MKPFRCYFLGTLGIFLLAIVCTGNLTITVFEMIIQSLGSIKLLFLQFNTPLFYWWFFSRGEQRRRKRFWPAVLHLTTLRGQARRFLSLSKIVFMKIKTNRKDSGFSYSWPFYHRQHQFNVLFLPCTCAKGCPHFKKVQFFWTLFKRPLTPPPFIWTFVLFCGGYFLLPTFKMLYKCRC